VIPSPYHDFGISAPVIRLSEKALEKASTAFLCTERIREINQLRVIRALQEARLSESTLGGSTGYGYHDLGRDQIEAAYARVMGAESALVRIQISSGTQALSLALYALLGPGDELLSVTGLPYDTLQSLIGINEEGKAEQNTNSLTRLGVHYREVSLIQDDRPDLRGIREALSPKTRVVFIQKSRGYASRRTLVADDIARVCRTVREAGSDAVVFVDNCYGEFVESSEPCMVGADLCAGSLIKNPGGGLCPSGGYVAGRKSLVDAVAERLNAPGLGRHVGPTLGFSRLIAQGLYLAPHTVAESVKGALFAAAFFQMAGFETDPGLNSLRGDIVQSIKLGSPDRLVAFCQAIQAASPVDSYVSPEPWGMPGYDDAVIMAAGTFIQGASIELSADGPLREPYPVYLQGGLCFDNIRLACMLAAERMSVMDP
jgi:cystathionine beta-lyase family protein involved in aluminum resistance